MNTIDWRRYLPGQVVLETRHRDTLRRTRIIMDGDTGLPVIVNEQNLKPFIEQNKREQSLFDPHIARANNVGSSGMTKVASIPFVVWRDLNRRGIAQNPVLFRKWLNRRDARYFRTDDCRPL
jgi:hypothetical protein